MARSVLKLESILGLKKLASDPSEVEAGFMYYNTTTSKIRVYNGSSYVEVGGSLVGQTLNTSNIIVGNGSNVSAAVDTSSLGGITATTAGGLVINANSITNSMVNTAAGIALSKLAALTGSRALQSDSGGIITPATTTSTELGFLSGTTSSVQTQINSKLSLSGGTMTGVINHGGFEATNAADPTSATSLATKGYVDAIKQGLDVKDSVRAATTANITLSGAQTIDGVSVIAGNRVLVMAQTASANNGIYVAAAGAWARSTDADTSAKVTSGMFTFVEEGTANGNSGYVLITADPIVLGTTSLSFTQFSGAGAIVAGNGLSKTGNTLDVNVDASTIEINADTLRVKDAGITNAKIATGVDAAKIGSGAVSNTEFGFLDGVTSAIQTQLNGKLSTVSQDTTPQLGGNLDLNGKTLYPLLKLGATSTSTDFIEEEYFHSIALSGSQTNAVITSLNIATATYQSEIIDYSFKQTTSNNVRVGTLQVSSNGTNIGLSSTFADSADTGISFDADISGGNLRILYTSGANGGTLRCKVKRFKA
jgi:hypothetical protein